MNVTVYEINKLPVAVIDNFYNEDELDAIWSEINFLNRGNKLLLPSVTGAAKDGDEYKKRGHGLFLYGLYNDAEKNSEIVKCSKKIFSIADELIDYHYFFRYIKDSEKDDVLLNYYENADYYKSHTDQSTVSCISWLHKEPKGYLGGDMILNKNFPISCLNNRVIVLPSIIEHEVTEVKIKTEESGYGRYSIVHFIT